jgi:hypothetical protein
MVTNTQNRTLKVGDATCLLLCSSVHEDSRPWEVMIPGDWLLQLSFTLYTLTARSHLLSIEHFYNGTVKLPFPILLNSANNKLTKDLQQVQYP